jgi:hypothetical protein
LDPARISESYNTGKTLVCRTLEDINLRDININKSKQTISIDVQLYSGFQATTHFFLLKNLGISSLSYSSDRGINPQVRKKITII